MKVRNSMKAIIVQDDHLLLTKNQDGEGDFYLFPGGGQEHGETFHVALHRECMEEIGAEVEIGELLFIREYIGKNHEHAEFDYDAHQVDIYFSCKLINQNQQQFTGTQLDEVQIGVEWIPLKELDHIRLYPKSITKEIMKVLKGDVAPIYLGDIN